MNPKFLFIFLPVFFTILFTGQASSQHKDLVTTRAVVIEGDTIPFIELKPVIFLAPRIFASRREEIRYTRLVHNVKRVYPFAKLAGIKYQEYNRLLSSLPESQRRRVARQLEQQIKDEFEGELRRLTITQGHILIKLIDRETNNTSYDVVKDFRGAFTAVFWQSIGRLFGYNLKTHYDPRGEDKLIEEIVLLIEQGII